MSDLAMQWLILFVDVSLKSALVALLAAAGLAALRVRDCNVRHRVWTGVLCGMLLLPALTQVVPALKLPFTVDSEWFAGVNRTDRASEPNQNGTMLEAEPVDAATPASIGDVASTALNAGAAAGRFNWPARPGRWPDGIPAGLPDTQVPADGTLALDSPSGEAAAVTSVKLEPALGDEPERGIASPVWRILLSYLPLALWIVWIAGGLVLGTRLLAGLWMARVLKRVSRPIDPADLPASQSGRPPIVPLLRAVPILTCPLIRVPLTLGVIRPRILLPPDWADWPVEKLQAVLIHERTHAERGDCALAFLAELNRCLYWFHPLAWWLRGRLASLAEAACDDAAIGATGDRAAYARHLLDVAATARAHRGRLIAGSVSMARCSSVESRINAILDFTRPLSRRLTRGTALMLVGTIAALIAFAAALRPATATEDVLAVADDAKVEAQRDPTAAGDRDGRESDGGQASTTTRVAQAETLPVQKVINGDDRNDDDDIELTYAGTVVAPDGKPVSEAKVFLCYFTHDPQPDLRPLAITGVDGSFRFSRRRREFDKLAESGNAWMMAELVATADGFGFALGDSAVFETTGKLAKIREAVPASFKEIFGKTSRPQTSVLKLVADDAPIRMRVLGVEGQPVAGVRISVSDVYEGEGKSLDAWERKATRRGALHDSSQEGLEQMIHGPRSEVVATLTRLDENGWWQIKGIGRERIATVQFGGVGIESAIFHIRTRRGETIRLPRDASDETGVETYHSAEFTHVASPAQPVKGRITDARTGTPLSGCEVRGEMLFHRTDKRFVFQFGTISTMTDATGSYRLDGLASGGNILLALPPRGSPYLPTAFDVKTGTRSEPLRRDVMLQTGVRIRGTVTDSRTGKPVLGSLQYMPFSNNPVVKGTRGFNRAYHLDDYYSSNSQGHFEIPVHSGKGVLSFTAYDHPAFPAGVGQDAVQAAVAAAGAEFESSRIDEDANRLTVVDFAAGTETSTVDLTLGSGIPIKLSVESPDGKVLSDYLVHGAVDPPFWQEQNEWQEEFDQPLYVYGYVPTERRRLMFYHPGRNLVGSYELSGKPPEEITIRLVPEAVVKGRITDATGAPQGDIELIDANDAVTSPAMRPLTNNSASGKLIDRRLDKLSKTRTAADGRFEIRGIIPGLKYSIDAIRHGEEQPRQLGSVVADLTLDSGEIKDLGDVVPAAKPRGVSRKTDSPTVEEKAVPKTEPSKGRDPTSTDNRAEGSPPKGRPTDISKAHAAQAGANAITCRGRVVDRDGKPVPDAKLYVPRELPDRSEDQNDLQQIGATDAQGRFDVRLPDSDPNAPHVETCLIVYRAGLAVNWVDLTDAGRDKPQEIVLQPEQIIRGRLVDTEGRPVAKAQVTFDDLLVPIAGRSLDQYLAARRTDPHDSGTKNLKSLPVVGLESIFRIESDADGRFTLPACAAETISSIVINAESIVSTSLWVVNRHGFTPQPALDANSKNTPWTMPVLAAPDFTHVCEPGHTIEGRVTTADDRPVQWVRIHAFPPTPGSFTTGYSTALTNADGYYRLTGLRRGVETNIDFDPDQQSGLLNRSKTIETGAAAATTMLNVELKRGILVTGQVIDTATGKGVHGIVFSNPVPGNEYVKQVAFEGYRGNSYETDAEGKFSTAVAPGPAVIKVQANGGQVRIGDQERSPYCRPFLTEEERRRTGLSKFDLKDYTAVKAVDFAPADGPQRLNFELQRGKTVDLAFVDEQGTPVENVFVSGVTEFWKITTQLTEPRCTVYALSAERPRKVLALHAERRLAGSVTLTGNEESPVKVVLAPTGSIRGRALTADGAPISNAELKLSFNDESARELYRFNPLAAATISTDNLGNFAARNIVPDEPFLFYTEPDQERLWSQPEKQRRKLTSGEKLDMGDLFFAPQKPEAPKVIQSSNDSAATKAATGAPTSGSIQAAQAGPGKATNTVRGSVVGPDGKPAANAQVAVVGIRRRAVRGGDLASNSEVLAEGTTGEKGRYQLEFASVSSKTHVDVNIVARADGCGLAWRPLDPLGDVSLKLMLEEVIRGRLIDVEGQPAGRVELSVSSVIPTVAPGTRSERGVHHVFDSPPRAWPPKLVAAEDGSFAIRGISAANGIHLMVAGTDRFAPQGLTINTGTPEERPNDDLSYRPLVRTIKTGEEGVLPLAPAQIFEGVVRYADTNEPAPHARLTIWASQQEVGGSMISVPGITDARGRYRINPYAGTRFGITAYPPAGVPYLIHEKRDITRKDDASVKQVDVALPRGVLLRGRVVESETKTAITGATIQYVPQSTTRARAPQGVVTGWQGLQLSGENGAFEICVLPGSGTLLISGPDGNFVSREFGSRELSRGLPGGQRNYAHQVEQVNPQANSEPLNLTIELQRGAVVSGHIANSAGEPVEQALLITRLNMHPLILAWRGSSLEALGDVFELSGLAEGAEYAVHFLDPRNRLGTTAMLTSREKTPKIVLLPCGEAAATFVDSEGKPVANHGPSLHFVLTPGPDMFDQTALNKGALAAETDFVANIDRLNYWPGPKTDANGRVTLHALIPGARYRITSYAKGRHVILKEFVAESAKTLDLGQFTVEVSKEE